MSLRRTISALAIAATVVAGLAVAPMAQAATRDHGSTLKVFLQATEREVLDLGATGATLGDVVTGSGTVRASRNGKALGTFAYRAETVRVNMPGGIESRQSTQWITLADGSIMTSSLISVPQGARPVASQEYVIVGGTGHYAGVAGTATFTPKSANRYVLTFDFID
ncbi:MAG: allene oxide cyclase barrel-like domain-containing protein [Candidatus Nanopelagicales bacterium]